jgi:hypothetical protein
MIFGIRWQAIAKLKWECKRLSIAKTTTKEKQIWKASPACSQDCHIVIESGKCED